MSREIKFKQYWRNDDTGIISTATHSLNQLKSDITGVDRHTLIGEVQYTGLHDRRGVEIFDSDIVKKDVSGVDGVVLWFAPTYAGYIIFHPEGGYIPDDWDGTYNKLDGRPGAFGDSHQLLVVGNIYENPDLLKAGDA